MSARKFGVGQSLKRVEDVRLVTGQGRYATDVSEGAELKAAFVRSPHAHARFAIADLADIRAMPGVRAVYAAADFADLGGLPCLAPVENSDGSQTPLKSYPVMADGVVDHVGDIVVHDRRRDRRRGQRGGRGRGRRLGYLATRRRHGGSRATRRAAGVRRRARQYRL